MLDGLVVGADSRIGQELLWHLVPHYKMGGTTRRCHPPWPSYTELFGRPLPGLFYCDITRDKLPEASVTYFCAAMTGLRECEAAPEWARRLNVQATVQLAQEQVHRGGKVVFLSSSAAHTHPGSVYGALKLEAEYLFSEMGKNASVVRFGPVINDKRPSYPDWPYNPISLQYLVKRLAGLMEKWDPGLHCMFDEEYWRDNSAWAA